MTASEVALFLFVIISGSIILILWIRCQLLWNCIEEIYNAIDAYGKDLKTLETAHNGAVIHYAKSTSRLIKLVKLQSQIIGGLVETVKFPEHADKKVLDSINSPDWLDLNSDLNTILKSLDLENYPEEDLK